MCLILCRHYWPDAFCMIPTPDPPQCMPIFKKIKRKRRRRTARRSRRRKRKARKKKELETKKRRRKREERERERERERKREREILEKANAVGNTEENLCHY